ncbi:MAG: helix-turn-helix transcriptional regulator [Devosiaceae bacterium]|nr:helix-turn-helix transcriptional regulator [Devosiaceae bacterium MH13]
MANKRAPNPIDMHVGSRLRMRRMMLSISQERLGEALGVSFQQVQKYEKGTNRIGAGRLQQIASELQVPISYFYDDMPGAEPAQGFAETGVSYVSDLLTTSDGLELTRAFLRIQDPKVRRRVVDLVKAIAETDGA